MESGALTAYRLCPHQVAQPLKRSLMSRALIGSARPTVTVASGARRRFLPHKRAAVSSIRCCSEESSTSASLGGAVGGSTQMPEKRQGDPWHSVAAGALLLCAAALSWAAPSHARARYAHLEIKTCYWSLLWAQARLPRAFR